MKINLVNLRIALFKLLVLFCPLDFFSFKIDTIDVSFFKLFSLLFVFFSVLLYLKNLNNYLIKINSYILIFLLYLFFSFFYGYLTFEETNLRYFFSIISFLLNILTFIFSYQLVTSIIISNDKKKIRNLKNDFRFIVKSWMICLLLAIPQVLLFLFGINLSYESLIEYAPENQGELFGLNLLRPNSFFGEPRSIAVFIIPITYIYFYLKNKEFNIISWIFILSIGILTQSSTFIVVLLISLFYLNFNRSFISPIISILFFILIILNFNLLTEFIPRLPNLFNLDLFLPETFNRELIGQLGDLSFIFYLINSFSNNEYLSLLIGNGLGTSSFILKSFINTIFNTEIDIVNSRLLFFTLLLEIGAFGIFLFFQMLKNILNSLNFIINKKSKIISYLFIFGSVFTGSYLFLFIINYLILFNKKSIQIL